MHPLLLTQCCLPPDLESCYETRNVALREAATTHTLETIVWECTRRCDLQCLHCGTPSEQHGVATELSTDQAEEMFCRLDEAFGLVQLTCISITGGEPTVRNDLIEMVGYIHAYGVSQIVTHTNGHQMAREPGLADALVRAGVTGIGFNLDGLRESHNWLRSNPEAFDCSISALRRSKDTGVDTMVSTVLTKRVLQDLPALRDLLCELRPDRWRLLPIEPIGRAPGVLTGELLQPGEIAEALSFVLECQTLELPFGVEMGCGQWYSKTLEGLVRPYIWHCIAGINVLGIMSDGAIGACNNIDRSYCQGNVLRDDVKDVWEHRFDVFREKAWAQSGECIDCSDWKLCRGGEMHMRNAQGKRISSCFFKWLEAGWRTADVQEGERSR